MGARETCVHSEEYWRLDFGGGGLGWMTAWFGRSVSVYLLLLLVILKYCADEYK
jgi:hypothetical protein